MMQINILTPDQSMIGLVCNVAVVLEDGLFGEIDMDEYESNYWKEEPLHQIAQKMFDDRLYNICEIISPGVTSDIDHFSVKHDGVVYFIEFPDEEASYSDRMMLKKLILDNIDTNGVFHIMKMLSI